MVSRLVVFVVFPVLALIAHQGWQLRQSLPQVSGNVAVPRLARPASIVRDAQGVPRIVARSDADAFFAMGYVHAQDRLWQLELQRRIAQGRLSEVFGKSSIDQDIWFRTLGLRRSAESAWSALSPDAQRSLQAYSDGINAWIASGAALPVEFRMLGIAPEPWTVYDSLAWIKVFALNLGGNYRREVERLLVSQVVDREKFALLFPTGAPPSTVAALDPANVARFAAFARFQDSLETQLHLGGRYVGSNAWVVSGKLGAGGAALMANDPHLGLQIPSLWYMASIKGDRIDAQGATLVGLPVVIFGRNASVAWGGTNLMADAQDLYLEQVDAADAGRYLVDGKPEAFVVRDEYITVRQDFPSFLRSPLQPLHVRVRESRHGPIVSDMFDVFEQPAALRWTALDPGDTSYEAFYGLNYASDWTSFQQALKSQVAPALNLLYADSAGNIGYIAAGRMPVRKNGDGTLPVPGWNDDYAWTGEIPFDRWPRRYNPEEGFLVSANEKPVGDDYPWLISQDWASPARAERIAALLREAVSAGRTLDVAAMQRIQADTRSAPAQRLLARLLKHEPNNDQQRRAFDLLRAWNGDMARDSRAATIFNAWMRELRRELLSDDLRGFWNKERESRYMKGVADNVELDTVDRILAGGDSAWCDDQATPARETCDDAIDASLNDALWEVLKFRGDESMGDWAWEDVHETVYRHVPFSDVNVLRSVFERRIGNGGSPDSVNVASFSLDKSRGYVQDFGAGFRQVVALGAGKVEHRYMNSTGQSGNVVSTHYDDMVRPFRDLEFLSLDPAAAGVDTLTLTPAAAAAQGGAP
ncbi:penicillin acylase family protein [Tahibacter sp.]|uniref:penicillin acylase family protein n=1 Tax=Tahibacter sp. TaxID=2056211 RepID=UPI002D808553|nr:penicillin acylase family protein [Tahibacter sp.]